MLPEPPTPRTIAAIVRAALVERADAYEPAESEYGVDGLYRYGPQRAKPSGLLKLLGEAQRPPTDEAPAMARGRTQLAQRRARASLDKRPVTGYERLIRHLAGTPMRVRSHGAA